jgi:hypothetical protein
MRAVYLKNFRKGFATNSSSTHSLIYRNKGEVFDDLNIFRLNYYDRFDETIAASKEAKIKYIAADIFYNEKLFNLMCNMYPEMKKYADLAEEQRKEEDGEKFGMYTRGRLYFSKSSELEATIDYLKNVIEDDDIIIVGGSDERDFVYETIKGHEDIPSPDDTKDDCGIVKNGNYWVGYGYDGKIRFKTEKGDCIPSYPELCDIRITNKCNNGCKFCYMDSTMSGKHADIDALKKIIDGLSTKYFDRYSKRVEFAVGGGNILLYPHLEELFHYMKEKGHIVNTTINAKDCEKVISDENLYRIFRYYVSGIGISVSEESDLYYLVKFRKAFTGNDYKHIMIHMIPEFLGVRKTRDLVNKLQKMEYYSVLFLGYKTNGRGISQEYHNFTDDDLKALFNEMYCISIDTTFAKKYHHWLKDNFDTDYTLTLNEGEYSMYIDGVEEVAYKSSYQLDKPYSLKADNYEGYRKNWFSPIEAFSNIRKDNGFKVYGEENTESA